MSEPVLKMGDLVRFSSLTISPLSRGKAGVLGAAALAGLCSTVFRVTNVPDGFTVEVEPIVWHPAITNRRVFQTNITFFEPIDIVDLCHLRAYVDAVIQDEVKKRTCTNSCNTPEKDATAGATVSHPR